MAPPALLLFTLQSPLPVRYPHPSKPALVIPPLLHRSLHTALDLPSPSASLTDGSLRIPSVADLAVPESRQNVNGSALADAVNDTELTVKIHLVSSLEAGVSRASWVQEALAILAESKKLGKPDNLLVGFKGIDYRGVKTCTSEAAPGTEGISPVLEDEVLHVWSDLFSRGGLVKEGGKLGTLYAPRGLLEKLAEREEKGISANVLDTPDCHHLPKDYTGFARDNGIALWASGGGEGSDPIPAPHLQNVLVEFLPKLKAAFPAIASSLDKVNETVPVDGDGKWDKGVELGVKVRWVLGFTVLSKVRNVVEDKGYIIAADFTK
ncbi:uncharacterized protein L203_100661 [Cryptococcus depauperatus CBS 7841]|uniref:Uncharacterized protein n=1 Tax=Cryptococcus depauperatus CBS 7841 TaxID=1295531 RepID=A0A1E3IX50_9TREE|nr:hypothetical protein L203_00446 [Cryptococcus depauperatus CBS 7841]